jgi:hypothetical protein
VIFLNKVVESFLIFSAIPCIYNLWIFDISLSLNSKSRYKVRHKTTDAAQSVFRTRVRGSSLDKIKEAESGRHFWKKHRMLGNACMSTDNPRENHQVGSGTRQDEQSAWTGTSLMFTQARLRAYARYLPV